MRNIITIILMALAMVFTDNTVSNAQISYVEPTTQKTMTCIHYAGISIGKTANDSIASEIYKEVKNVENADTVYAMLITPKNEYTKDNAYFYLGFSKEEALQTLTTLYNKMFELTNNSISITDHYGKKITIYKAFTVYLTEKMKTYPRYTYKFAEYHFYCDDLPGYSEIKNGKYQSYNYFYAITNSDFERLIELVKQDKFK